MQTFLWEAERSQYHDRLAEQAYSDLGKLAEARKRKLSKLGSNKVMSTNIHISAVVRLGLLLPVS